MITNKTILLLFIAMLTGIYTWGKVWDGSSAFGWIMFGAIGGLVVALFTAFKPHYAGITAPVYAALEGLFLGGISAQYALAFEGLVFQAIILTFAVFFGMLLLYRSGVIKVTDKLKSGIFAATAGIALLYLVGFVLSFFGTSIPMIHGNGFFGIGFSLLVVGIAAFNLLIDFDFIENAAREGAPSYLEWYGAFGLMVTLVWLYVEILRLLAKLQSRD